MKSIRLSIVCALIFLSGCLFNNREKEGIYPYDKERDRSYILQETEKSRFWLVADEAVGYDQESTLDTGLHCFVKAPTHFYMYYKDKKPVGFISYYFESPLFAKIQFVFVDEGYRRQGIADKMIRFILEKIRKEGACSVEICTRLINVPAWKLYEKLGFKKLYDNGKYIYLDYSWCA